MAVMRVGTYPQKCRKRCRLHLWNHGQGCACERACTLLRDISMASATRMFVPGAPPIHLFAGQGPSAYHISLPATAPCYVLSWFGAIDSGLARSLASRPIAYKTWGSLNRSRGLAVEGFSQVCSLFRTSLTLIRKWVACSDVRSHVAKYATAGGGTSASLLCIARLPLHPGALGKQRRIRKDRFLLEEMN